LNPIPRRRVQTSRTTERAAVSTPALWEDDDARKLAHAPTDGPRSYLHHDDGTWSFVGDDGWPVSPEEFCAELHADTMSAIAAVTFPVIDVEPVSVTDTEAR
jgi:hypothetical protein